MRVLILGATGQVGSELAKLYPDALKPNRTELNLLQTPCVGDYLRKHKPSLIINAAAYTNVDGAETEEKMAFIINSDANSAINKYAVTAGARIVYYSSDYIYNPPHSNPVQETEKPNPPNVYARSKLCGEKLLTANHLILRVSWVYSPKGKNFVTAILKKILQDEPLKVVCDQIGAVTPADFIAKITKQAIDAGLEGVYNLAPDGFASWYDVASMISESSVRVPIEMVLTENCAQRAKRPFNSRLDCSKIKKDLGIEFLSWDVYLKERLLKVWQGEA